MVGNTKRRYIYIVTTSIYHGTDVQFDEEAIHSELFTNEIKAKQYMISLLGSLFPSSCLLVNRQHNLVSLLNDTSSEPDIIQIRDLEPNQMKRNDIVFETDVVSFDYIQPDTPPKGFIKLQTAIINERLEKKVKGSCSHQNK